MITIVPVATAQVGCMVVLAVAAGGAVGWALMIIFADAGEIQSRSFVTVKLNVDPAVKPDIEVLEPDPVIAPGLIVQLPEGKPFNTTLPVGTPQVGCVMMPTAGVAGPDG